jgi:hypothetical protein
MVRRTRKEAQMNLKKSKLLVVGSAIAAAVLATAAPAGAQDGANYTVTFTRTWTGTTHPFEYPEPGLVSGPHFSGLIGASHGDAYDLFKEGVTPTPGLEKLSEEGKHSPLDKEIQAAIKSGKAGALFETGPIKDESKTETTKVHVTDKFPMVSAVAMIAPSPDWFAGVADVNLKEGGKWVQTKTVELYPMDSGGDDGVTYKAPDKNTNPKKMTMKASTRHFVTNGKTAPVGTLTFTLQP